MDIIGIFFFNNFTVLGRIYHELFVHKNYLMDDDIYII